MKHLIEVILESKINQEGEITNIKRQGEGYLKIEGETTTVFFKTKDDKYKYVYRDNELEIIKDDAYKIGLNKDKKCDFRFEFDGYSLMGASETTVLDVEEGKVETSYSLFINGSKIGDYQSKLTYNIKRSK